MGNTVLVVAAHSDDEVLGCGATMARHSSNGDDVFTVFMTDGVSSRNSPQQNLVERRRACEEAQHQLGVRKSFHLDFPDNSMDTVPLLDVTKSIEEIVFETKPSIIYTHFHGDLNVDHRVTHQAVMTASRPVPGSVVSHIYGFEVVSSTGWPFTTDTVFQPQLFVDVSNYFDTKLSALKSYSIEMRAAPHARSIDCLRSLAKYRGNNVGMNLAEAFVIYRSLDR